MLPSNPSRAFIEANPHLYGHPTPSQIPNTKPERNQGEPLAAPDAGAGQRSGCPAIRFLLRRVKLLDVDAKFASVKDLLDGLAIGGAIPGDAEGQITLDVSQEKVGHYAEEETLITITYQ